MKLALDGVLYDSGRYSIGRAENGKNGLPSLEKGETRGRKAETSGITQYCIAIGLYLCFGLVGEADLG